MHYYTQIWFYVFDIWVWIPSLVVLISVKKFIPDGKIHASRQHNIIITGNDINDDTCWVPIQVVAEVTGKSR